MRVTLVVGVRPHFVKLLVLRPALEVDHEVRVVHTGQHYDDELAGRFFRMPGAKSPDLTLTAGEVNYLGCLPGMVEDLRGWRPDVVLVIGDANSSLLGAVAGSVAGVPVVHVEAGVRSNEPHLTEERNRRGIDAVASMHFASSPTAVQNLEREGIERAVLVGDLLLDALGRSANPGRDKWVLGRWGLESGRYIVFTTHREENRDDIDSLSAIIKSVVRSRFTVVASLHPATREAVTSAGLDNVLGDSDVRVVGSVDHDVMTLLLRHSAGVVTDSSGVQREAYFLGKYCVVLRATTEFPYTILHAAGEYAGANEMRIEAALARVGPAPFRYRTDFTDFGGGNAARRISAALVAITEGGPIRGEARA